MRSDDGAVPVLHGHLVARGAGLRTGTPGGPSRHDTVVGTGKQTGLLHGRLDLRAQPVRYHLLHITETEM